MTLRSDQLKRVMLPLGSIKFNRNNKFDLQLSDALRNERRLAEIFSAAKIEKIELKSETWLWERTGNICIEYRQNGRPSGICVTEADYWVHELRRNGATLPNVSNRAFERVGGSCIS